MIKKLLGILAIGFMCGNIRADATLDGQVIGGSDDLVTVNVGLATIPYVTKPTSALRVATIVAGFHQHGLVQTDVGLQLDPDYVLLDEAQNNELVAAFGQFTAKGTYSFTFDQVRYRERSADAGNALGSFLSYSNGNFNFGPDLIGVDIAGNPRTNGPTAGVQLKKLTFGAVLSAHWNYPQDASYQVLTNHVINNIRTVWFGFGLQGTGSNLAGWSERMLTINPVTQPDVRLYITLTNHVARVTGTNNTSSPGILQWTSAVGTNTVWSNVSSANAGGGTISEVVTNGVPSFYRVYLQGAQ